MCIPDISMWCTNNHSDLLLECVPIVAQPCGSKKVVLLVMLAVLVNVSKQALSEEIVKCS